MGKQKVVIRLPMTDAKKRSRALTTVVGLNGVSSASVGGEKEDQIVVVGDGIDPVALVEKLRKRMKYAELLSVAPADEKKEEAKPKPKDEVKIIGWPHHFGMGYPDMYSLNYEPWCCIM